MAITSIDDIQLIPPEHRSALRRAGYTNPVDLLLSHPQAISRRAKVPQSTIEKAVSLVEKECAAVPIPLVSLERIDDKFTTGDAVLDCVVGGGIRTGVIWEVVGESASGKTQLALQLSLMVQIPRQLGGLDGASCYLTTSSQLPTKRLAQLLEEHPALLPTTCSLDNVHTRSTPTLAILMYILRETLMTLIADLKEQGRKPLRLLIIDSIAPLFQSEKALNSSKLTERAKAIYELSSVLHGLATQYELAIIVINDVTDVLHHEVHDQKQDISHYVTYGAQAEWFSRSTNAFGGKRKEAALGLAWANQTNIRIMLIRTSRRKHLSEDQTSRKRPRLSYEDERQESLPEVVSLDTDECATIFRRLTVMFSAVSLPGSADFIVTSRGITGFSDTASAGNVVLSTPEVPSKTNTADIDVTVNTIMPISDAPVIPKSDTKLPAELLWITPDAVIEAEEDVEAQYWNLYDDHLDEDELLDLESQVASTSSKP